MLLWFRAWFCGGFADVVITWFGFWFKVGDRSSEKQPFRSGKPLGSTYTLPLQLLGPTAEF